MSCLLRFLGENCTKTVPKLTRPVPNPRTFIRRPIELLQGFPFHLQFHLRVFLEHLRIALPQELGIWPVAWLRVAGAPRVGHRWRTLWRSGRWKTRQATDAIPGTTTVVATCGHTERIFVFQTPTRFDPWSLMRSAPDVEAVWDLGRHLISLLKLGPRGDLFDEATPSRRSSRRSCSYGPRQIQRNGRTGFSKYLFAESPRGDRQVVGRCVGGPF